MLLMIDNYDSFTYNIVQYLSELGAEVEVVRNDQLSLAEIEKRRPQSVVISPGRAGRMTAAFHRRWLKSWANTFPF